jgi:hypothetical protein
VQRALEDLVDASAAGGGRERGAAKGCVRSGVDEAVAHLARWFLARPEPRLPPVVLFSLDAAIEAVEENRFEPVIRPASFSLTEFNKDMAGTNAKLMEALNGR